MAEFLKSSEPKGYAANVEDILHWVQNSKYGDFVCYCHGELALQREFNKQLSNLSDILWGEMMRNRISLVQKRTARNCFQYYAVNISGKREKRDFVVLEGAA